MIINYSRNSPRNTSPDESALTQLSLTREERCHGPGANRASVRIRAASFSLFLLALFVNNQASGQSSNSDFLLFVSGEYADRSGKSEAVVQSSDFTPAADLLYTYANGPWRVLGEYYLTDDESEL